MPPEEIVRRASYGRNSPAVRERGARTRQQILDETLRLFAEKGYYDTLSDDIADRVGIARATLYQYFDGKEAIFRELMEECATVLTRLVRRLGVLGQTEQGFDNLHWWLGEWSWVYGRYATVFTQWTQVGQASALSESVGGFVDAYSARIAGRLVECGVSGIDPAGTAAMVTIVVNRVQFHRVNGMLDPLTEEQVVDALAVALQLLLFPGTSSDILNSIVTDPLPTLSPTEPATVDRSVQSDRFAALGPRARATAERLLDAACEVFAERSYHLGTIDEVVTRAGTARGTFYKYFKDKPDLLTAVLERAYREVPVAREGWGEEPFPGADLRDRLTAMLGSFLPWHRRYAGALRVGFERLDSEESIHTVGLAISVRVTWAFEMVLAEVHRDYPFAPRVAAVIMFAIAGRGLDSSPTTVLHRTREEAEALDFVVTLLARGLFAAR
ncbi:TetR/AcrR family transcriptional regulator [Streptomyces sp. NPDC096311]|uniref:TetR/AcrR family transcriptional regulator n=1 Tax=Streptomyces sp. NPDC096311 TaxID=3366083 RepID=UPI003824AB7B